MESLVLKINFLIYIKLLFFVEITFLYLYWANSDLTIYGDPKDFEHLQQECALYLPNHRGEIDWLIALVFNKRFRLLGVNY